MNDPRRYLWLMATLVFFVGRDVIAQDERNNASQSMEPGTQTILDHPYSPSHLKLTSAAIKKRLYRGMNVIIDGSDRDLSTEQFWVRIPQGYDESKPSTLLIWSSPTPQGRIPSQLNLALDELSMICIGIDNAGNARDTQDKLQLHLDAVATAKSRFKIDEERIFIAGLSGGGKMSSILTICFPEVFHGAVSIVGLASHHTLESSWGDHRYPYFTKPVGAIWRRSIQRPIAIVSGPPDFNYKEMQERARLLHEDGFAGARFFEHEDMAHQMPTPQQFLNAMRHVTSFGRVESSDDKDRESDTM